MLPLCATKECKYMYTRSTWTCSDYTIWYEKQKNHCVYIVVRHNWHRKLEEVVRWLVAQNELIAKWSNRNNNQINEIISSFHSQQVVVVCMWHLSFGKRWHLRMYSSQATKRLRHHAHEPLAPRINLLWYVRIYLIWMVAGISVLRSSPAHSHMHLWPIGNLKLKTVAITNKQQKIHMDRETRCTHPMRREIEKPNKTSLRMCTHNGSGVSDRRTILVEIQSRRQTIFLRCARQTQLDEIRYIHTQHTLHQHSAHPIMSLMIADNFFSLLENMLLLF